ncbi:uncharacterized protein LOC100741287 [Bombus impatiens]|uniref:Uncharacterized protein LOC100741287 n=1 Tax=Bombus impatiens TaxID=132113 RepID=A0A6P6FF30_BOMIM|nr:uncharacterized protein LOC100741287 [Bombus impatiens]
MNTMIRIWILCSLFLLGYVQECWQLVIKSVNVPATVKADDTDYVILDCDYDLENTPSKGLVVKWFFNTNEVAYQWIYGREPLAGDTARKYIDLQYKASDDPYTKYRAMKLNKPGIDLTGEYTCVIFTYADEQSASGSMVVYCKYPAIYGQPPLIYDPLCRFMLDRMPGQLSFYRYGSAIFFFFLSPSLSFYLLFFNLPFTVAYFFIPLFDCKRVSRQR